jgi:hypothetical protein
MATDRRLDAHAEILKTALGAYLVHLAASWQVGRPDTVSRLGAVLASVGAEVNLDDGTRDRLVARLDDVRAIEGTGFAQLAACLELAAGEELIVAATWWSEVDAQLRSIFGVLHDDGTRRHPSSGLLHAVFQPYGIDVPVQPRRLVEAGVVTCPGPGERLGLTPTARELIGGDGGVRIGRLRAGEELPDRLHGMVAPLVDLLASTSGAVVLRGVPGAGRRPLAAAAAAKLGRTVVGRDRPDEELRLLARVGVALPVLDAGRVAGLAWEAGYGPLVAIADPEDEVGNWPVIDVPGPDRVELRRLWAGVLDSLSIADEESSTVRLAEQFSFTERDVNAACARARLIADLADRPLTVDDVWTAAQRQPDLDLQRVAVRITPVFTFADLVLAEPAMTQLHELVGHVRHRTTVLDEWGFRRRLPRGQGVAALFSGLPGTGKTTAAEAIANELRAELFRVDLSRVVSKYIGETEKNLAIAFREAERGGALLLFDEADALFGKRTEVRDAHDRYANLEVSYLLQRVESFTGLVILSTNKLGNIDDAFLRRLRFIIRFESPDAERREALWRRSFPAAAKLSELDWSRHAAHDLSGGHIQNAAVAAAFLAVGEGVAVSDDHVERAIAREYEKLDRAAPSTRSDARR